MKVSEILERICAVGILFYVIFFVRICMITFTDDQNQGSLLDHTVTCLTYTTADSALAIIPFCGLLFLTIKIKDYPNLKKLLLPPLWIGIIIGTVLSFFLTLTNEQFLDNLSEMNFQATFFFLRLTLIFVVGPLLL